LSNGLSKRSSSTGGADREAKEKNFTSKLKSCQIGLYYDKNSSHQNARYIELYTPLVGFFAFSDSQSRIESPIKAN
jgi:hypothetical protein